MKDLVSTNFFRILQEGIDKDADTLQNEYDDFANTVFSFGNVCAECTRLNSIDRISCYNLLIYTRVELSSLIKTSGKNAAELLSYLEKAIELVDKQMAYIADSVVCPLKQKVIRLKWMGTLLDYVEWVYGLHEFLNQSGEKVSLKILFETFNPIFSIEVQEYAQYFRTIKSRTKGERTTFLDKQKKLLTERIEKSDQTPSKK